MFNQHCEILISTIKYKNPSSIFYVCDILNYIVLFNYNYIEPPSLMTMFVQGFQNINTAIYVCVDKTEKKVNKENKETSKCLMVFKLTKSIMRGSATRSLDVTRVQAVCDSAHITVSALHVEQETRRDRPSSGLPNVCRVCVTTGMFHSVHKHVVVLMVTKEIREGAYYKKKGEFTCFVVGYSFII